MIRRPTPEIALLGATLALIALVLWLGLLETGPGLAANGTTAPDVSTRSGMPHEASAQEMLEEGRQIFRHDTFGDETYWGDALQLHQAIQGERFGGVGPGVAPRQALALGLKVDSAPIPAEEPPTDPSRPD